MNTIKRDKRFILKIKVFTIIKFFLISLLTLIVVLTSCIENKKKYNVLVFTGGKKFERESFLKIFDDLSNIEYNEVVQPQANDMYSAVGIDSFDALVFYDVVQEINEDQKEAFIKLLNNGKGIVFLHHSLVSYQEWDEYEKIIGGRYYQSTNKTDSLKFPQSTYRHDVKIPVEIVNKEHPITKGLNEFIIHDEVYGKFKILTKVSPIITTTHPESAEVIGWTNKYGKSRIVYIQLGHDHHAYDDANYRRLIKQSIEWVVRG